MTIKIKNRVVLDDGFIKVSELKDLATKGGDKLFATMSTKPGMLQRPLQEEEWKKLDFERCQGYMYTLFIGAGRVDNIILVPVKLVIQSLKKKQLIGKLDIPEKTFQIIIDNVENDYKNGTKFYIIDGQNRIVNAICGFYEDEYPLIKNKDGKELIAVDDKTGEETYLNGKRYSQLPKNCQDHLDRIKLNVLTAQEGEIDIFVATLIAKNQGVSWTEWMMLWTNSWFSLYRNKVEEITSNPVVNEALNQVLGKEYLYDKYGHDLITSELLVWMEKKQQLTKYDYHKPYLAGNLVIKSSHFKNLKTYLIEIRNGYINKEGKFAKKIHNVELRNYVKFRYAIDHPTEFNNIFAKFSLPKFKVNMKADFVARFRQYDKTLKADPNNYIINPQFKKKVKAPGFYIYANSEQDRDSIELRLELLFKHLAKDLDFLKKKGIIKIIDTTPMPLIEVVAMDDLTEISTKRELRPSEALSGDFHRGHKIAVNNEGTNDISNVRLHEKIHNKTIKDRNIS